jgi:choline dehydrogenase
VDYDVIVIGAGSAGAVTAARLSEDANCSILLLEAGPDFGRDAENQPEAVRNALDLSPTNFDWGHQGIDVTSGRSIDLHSGCLVGGSSATNNVMALRGHPVDYDRWAALGNPGWGFDEVLPYFRRVETEHDYPTGEHGTSGPLPIRRFAPQEMTPVQQAFLMACSAAGYPGVDDHNRRGAQGAGRVPLSQVGGVRQSTAVTYLAAAQGRANLTVRADSPVDRIVLRANRAVGVRLARAAETIGADKIIVCAGAYGSPQILMRSGIGPAHHLQDLDIDVAIDLPGVGGNLQDHPLLRLVFLSRGPAQRPGEPLLQTLLTCAADRGIYDLHIFPVGVFGAGDLAVVSMAVSVVHPLSKGRITLTSTRWDSHPRIDTALLADPDDVDRLLSAIRLVDELCAISPMTQFVTGRLWPDRTLSSPAGLTAAVREQVVSYQHPVGTCRMGTDGEAVVDCRGAVHGIERLHVVDASIMPAVPRANTNLPTLMVAERCSAWMRQSGSLSNSLDAVISSSAADGPTTPAGAASLAAGGELRIPTPTSRAGTSS